MRSVISHDWKYIATTPGLEELYNLKDDPAEEINLSAGCPEEAQALRDYLEAFEQGCVKLGQVNIEMTVDDKLLEELKSLGYFR